MQFKPIAPQVTIAAVETSFDREKGGQNVDGGWTLVTNSCGHIARCAPHFSYKIGEKRNCFSCQEALDKAKR